MNEILDVEPAPEVCPRCGKQVGWVRVPIRDAFRPKPTHTYVRGEWRADEGWSGYKQPPSVIVDEPPRQRYRWVRGSHFCQPTESYSRLWGLNIDAGPGTMHTLGSIGSVEPIGKLNVLGPSSRSPSMGWEGPARGQSSPTEATGGQGLDAFLVFVLFLLLVVGFLVWANNTVW